MGDKFRGRRSVSMFFTQFKMFRISTPTFIKIFGRSTTEIILLFESDNANIIVKLYVISE